MAVQQEGRKPLQIAAWNPTTISDKKTELEEILDRFEIDVMALQETKLHPDDTLRIRGYQVYRIDRNRRSGGVALLIRNGLDYHPVILPEMDHLEAAGIIIKPRQPDELRIVSSYQRPQRTLLAEDLNALFPEGPGRTLAIGDFNAKSPHWNSRITNQRGRELLRFVEARADILVHGPIEPTFYQGDTRPDVIDIAVTQNLEIGGIRTLREGSSNHDPILVSIENEGSDEPSTFIKKHINWISFRRCIQQRIQVIPPIETPAQLEEAVERLEEDILAALRESTTERTVRRDRNPTGEIPEETKQLIRERRAAKRRAHRTRDPEDRHRLNQLNRRVRQELNKHRQERWTRYLEGLDTADQNLWRTQKILRSQQSAKMPLHGERGLVYSDEDKAEAFADNLERQCRDNQLEDEDEDWTDEVERRARRIPRTQDGGYVFRPATPEELKAILKSLKTRKAPGADGIRNRALKNLPRKGIAALLNIANATMRLRHFPERWKKADVIFIPKPGKNLLHPSNYRPISLLPSTSKVVERIILDRLKEQTEELNVIPDEQFAYRPAHSTELQVLRLVEHVTKGFQTKHVTGAVFLDVAKAFDRVWHDGLLIKMLDMGYPIEQVKLIRSYLTRRKIRAKAGGALSDYRSTEAGVPQGAVLSPLLFAIYTADLPRTQRTAMALYADDTAIVASSRRAHLATRYLQEAVLLVENWCNRWKVDINAEKSHAVLFQKTRQAPAGYVTINGEDIQWTNRTKYLGVTLDSSLTWKHHVNETANIAKATLGRLHPMLYGDSKLNLRNKMLLVRQVIQPKLMYASTAWGYAARTHLNKLQRIENVALRRAVDAPWFVRNADIQRDLGYRTVTEKIRDRARKVYEQTETHENPLIRAATDYDPGGPSRHKRPKLQVV